jgi:curved DNA-binding protein CbpA
MPQARKDYYKILQVDLAADAEIIAVAYRRLARKYHPDTNQSPDATQRMQEINAVYQVLRDPVKRAQYDSELAFSFSRAQTREEEEYRTQEEAKAAWRHTEEEQCKRSPLPRHPWQIPVWGTCLWCLGNRWAASHIGLQTNDQHPAILPTATHERCRYAAIDPGT